MAPLAGTRAANRYGWVIVLIIVSYVTSVGADGTLGITVVMLFQLVTLWLVFPPRVVPGTATGQDRVFGRRAGSHCRCSVRARTRCR